MIRNQAKGIVKGSSDFSNVRKNLKKAIGTLSAAYKKHGELVEKLILITNSMNPLNEDESKKLFYGPPVEFGYDDLPNKAKKVIDDSIKSLDVSFDTSKFAICFFMFETDNLRTRYRVIEEEIREFINECNLGNVIDARNLMLIWQNYIFRNGSQTDVKIVLSKKEIIWPVIVLTLEKLLPVECIEDYDNGIINEIIEQYSNLINVVSEQYDFITKILFGYKEYKSSNSSVSFKVKELIRGFISDKWKDYVSVFSFEKLDEEVQEAVTKVILAKVIQQRYLIDRLREVVSL